MAEHDAAIACADAPRREHVLALALREHTRAHQSREKRHASERERVGDIDRAWSQNGDHGDANDDARKREQHIVEAHDDAVDPAAEVAAQHARRHSECRANRGGEHADDQRHPRAIQHAAEQISSELVSAQEELRARRLQHVP